MNKIVIQNKGSFFSLDDEGYIINPASWEKVDQKWLPIIDEIIAWYKKAHPQTLTHVYIRGSVVKGEAVEGISDIDSFAFIDLPNRKVHSAWCSYARHELKQKYPNVTDFELSVSQVSEAHKKQIVLCQALCVHGEPLVAHKLKPGPDLYMHLPGIQESLQGILSELETTESSEEIIDICVWTSKHIVRTGLELCLTRSKKYSRDLYKCWEIFAEYYPGRSDNMLQVVDLVLNPSTDKAKLVLIFDFWREWFEFEVRNLGLEL